MRIAVWGAGAIGSGVAYRLTTTPFTSRLYWINRTYENVESRVVDIEHGLAFAPSCWGATACLEEEAAEILREVGMLILTLGAPVPPGKTRQDVYTTNCGICREAVIPALRQGFEGVVLVVTNPVDLIARFIQKETGLPPQRVLGLGTVVETARLRRSLASYLSPPRPAREIWAYAVGSHDQNFVPVAMDEIAMGLGLDPEQRRAILEDARGEVVEAADRVKADEKSTLHPIVEGAVEVAEAVALDRRSILTVSVLDTDEDLYYSLPCTVGSNGLIERHLDLLQAPEIRAGLETCREGLRATLKEVDS